MGNTGKQDLKEEGHGHPPALPCLALNGPTTQSWGLFMANRGFGQSLSGDKNRFGDSHPLPLQN